MKNDKRAKVEVITKLNLYEPTSIESADSEKINFSKISNRHSYFKVQSQNFHKDDFYHYPIIVDSDGSPWEEANRYLLSHLGGINPAKHRTLESIALDLVHFRRWMVEEDIDYLNIKPRPRARPTYRYTAYLHGEIQLGKCKPSTAKRRISNMQNFYRWLEKDGYKFNYPLWIENDLIIGFTNAWGVKKSKPIKSTDLTQSIKLPKNKGDNSEHIYDGGKLRPLPKEEQLVLVEALHQLGNIEMLFSFLLALTTGARLQTIFTFRQKNFNQKTHKNISHHRIKVGSSTLVDTKYNKQIVLHIPEWLYQRIQIYLCSERYKKRVTRSKHIPKHDDEQYVFLTRSGRPYYMAQNDDFAFLYRTPPRGNAITQFIRQQLKPKLKENGHDFNFRFHDLRATFGMNLLENALQDFPLKSDSPNEPGLLNILNFIRTRLGHSQLKTTESYLNYKQNKKISGHVQDEFELYLKSMIEVKKQ